MPSYFWTNTIWYIALGITTLLQLVYVLYKSKRRKQVCAFYLTASGLIFVFEATIFMIFKSYNYYPMIIPGNTLHDGLIGNLFSQFSVCATALLIVTLNLDYRYYIIFTVIYGLIEELFLLLGIYRHNWYQTWMTVLSFPLYCMIVKLMYIRMNTKLTPLLSYIYMFLGLWGLYFGITVFPFMVYGYQIYHVYIFSDSTTNATILMILNYIIHYSMIRRIYFTKYNWLLKSIGIFILLLINYIQYMLQVMYVKDGWLLIYSTINIISLYFYIWLYDSLYGQSTKNSGN